MSRIWYVPIVELLSSKFYFTFRKDFSVRSINNSIFHSLGKHFVFTPAEWLASISCRSIHISSWSVVVVYKTLNIRDIFRIWLCVVHRNLQTLSIRKTITTANNGPVRGWPMSNGGSDSLARPYVAIAIGMCAILVGVFILFQVHCPCRRVRKNIYFLIILPQNMRLSWTRSGGSLASWLPLLLLLLQHKSNYLQNNKLMYIPKAKAKAKCQC